MNYIQHQTRYGQDLKKAIKQELLQFPVEKTLGFIQGAVRSVIPRIAASSGALTAAVVAIPFIAVGLASTLTALFEKPNFRLTLRGLIHPFAFTKQNHVFTRPIKVESVGELPVFDGRVQATLISIIWVSVAQALFTLNRLPISARAKAVTEMNKGLPFVFNFSIFPNPDTLERDVKRLVEKLSSELDRKLFQPIIRAGGQITPIPEAVVQQILQINQGTIKVDKSGDHIIVSTKIDVPLSLLQAGSLEGAGLQGVSLQSLLPIFLIALAFLALKS